MGHKTITFCDNCDQETPLNHRIRGTVQYGDNAGSSRNAETCCRECAGLYIASQIRDVPSQSVTFAIEKFDPLIDAAKGV